MPKLPRPHLPNPRLPRKFLPLYVIACLLIILGAAGGSFVYAYSDTYYPGVQVEGVSLSGLSKDEGKRLVQERADTYAKHSIVLAVSDLSKPRLEDTNRYPDIEMKTTAKELGLSYQTEKAVQEAWSVGHTSSAKEWVSSVAQTLLKRRAVTLPYAINAETINTYIHTQVRPNISTPKPATIAIDGDAVTVKDPLEGLEVDEAKLSQMLVSEMNHADEAETSYLRVPVTQLFSPVTRKVVQPLAEQLDQLGNKAVTLTAGDQSVKAKRSQVLQLFTTVQDDKGKVDLAVSNEGMYKLLKETKLNLDQKKSHEALSKSMVELLDAQQKGSAAAGVKVALTVKPGSSKEVEPGQVTLGKYEGKYVEVNLKDQKLYAIEGDKLVKAYRVSTGKWSTPTPKGEFAISGKVKRAYSASYGLYMPYWQNFLNGKYGFHELPEWPNGYKEGASHIGTPVSHGCVRLGTGDAEELYNWTENGTPVYIH